VLSAFQLMLRYVTQVGDPALAAYRDVGDPAALERAGLFVAEGRLIVERLLEDGRFHVDSVAVTQPAAVALAGVFAARPDIPVLVCEPDVLQSVTGFDFHRGCLALARRIAADVPLEGLLPAARILALEGVGNPDNVGGLFRTAFALGADAILLDGATGDPLYRKAIRTSMGATLRVPYARAANWPGAITTLRANGFRIIALTPHPEAVALDDASLAAEARLVLVVGSEGHGLTPGSLDYADLRVRIPIDPRADSLNVVVAAGIALKALLVR
jgi:tRNA G18 (ribose-2'-O)-methylase SpoU